MGNWTDQDVGGCRGLRKKDRSAEDWGQRKILYDTLLEDEYHIVFVQT